VDIAPLPKGRKQITLKYKTKHALSGSHIHPTHNDSERNNGKATDRSKKARNIKRKRAILLFSRKRKLVAENFFQEVLQNMRSC